MINFILTSFLLATAQSAERPTRSDHHRYLSTGPDILCDWHAPLWQMGDFCLRGATTIRIHPADAENFDMGFYTTYSDMGFYADITGDPRSQGNDPRGIPRSQQPASRDLNVLSHATLDTSPTPWQGMSSATEDDSARTLPSPRKLDVLCQVSPNTGIHWSDDAVQVTFSDGGKIQYLSEGGGASDGYWTQGEHWLYGFTQQPAAGKSLTNYPGALRFELRATTEETPQQEWLR